MILDFRLISIAFLYSIRTNQPIKKINQHKSKIKFLFIVLFSGSLVRVDGCFGGAQFIDRRRVVLWRVDGSIVVYEVSYNCFLCYCATATANAGNEILFSVQWRSPGCSQSTAIVDGNR